MRNRRTLALLFITPLAAASLLTACTSTDVSPRPSESASVADPTATPADRPCADDFSAQIDRQTDATYIVITNQGSAPCTLTGFPTEGVFVNESGPIQTIGYEGSPTADEFGRASTAVTVEPGADAFVWAHVSRTVDREIDHPCEFPVDSTGVSILLPGATEHVVAPAVEELCLDLDSDDLQVGPVDSEARPASTIATS